MRNTRGFCNALAWGAYTLCFSSAVLAQNAAEDRLDQLLMGVETLSADVLQLIVESDGGVLEESDIRMYLMRPDGFYWETLNPFPELVVTDGETLWNYQPDLEQLVVEDWDSSQSELAAQLLSGETAQLKSDYLIEQTSAELANNIEFRLIPRAADSVYSSITISFQQEVLDAIHLSNKNGQQTLWQFQQVQRNMPLDASLFQFEAPPGIEVVNNSSRP